MLDEPKFVKRFRIVVANVGKEYSVCEIYYQHEKWAVIEQKEELVVHFLPRSSGSWELPLVEAIEVLQKAKKIFIS